MKTLLAIVVLATSVSAFAQKHMVTLTGYETGERTDRSLDFAHSNGGNGANKENESNIALNYAYAVTDAWQVGASYKKYKLETGGEVATVGDESETIGLQVIYNIAGRLTDTSYVAVHYDMNELEDSQGAKDGSETNIWGLEFGHRFLLGKLAGMDFNYSPSATASVANTDFNASGSDEASTTSVTINFVKFDVLF